MKVHYNGYQLPPVRSGSSKDPGPYPSPPPPPGPQVHQPLFRAKFDRIHWCPQGFLDTPRPLGEGGAGGAAAPPQHPWWKTRTSFVVARTVFFFFFFFACHLSSAPPQHPCWEARTFFFFFFACQLSAAPPVQKSFTGTWGFVSNTGRRDSRVFLCSKGRLGQKSTRFWKLNCLTKIQTPYSKLMIMVSFYWKINVLPNKKIKNYVSSTMFMKLR